MRAGELPETSSVEHLVEQASDIAIMIGADGTVEGISVNSECPSLGCLDHWIGRDFDSFLTVESRAKFAERRRALEAKPDSAPRSVQLNHVDNAVWEFPIRYTLHRVTGRDSYLLFGRDMQPIADVQQRLVAEQTSRERDQQKIRRNETFFRVVLEASETPLMLVEPETGKITDLNSSAALLFGTKTDTLAGTSLAQALEGRRKSELIDNLQAAASAEDVKAIEVTARRSGRDLVVFPRYFRAAGELVLLCRLTPVDEADGAGPEAAQSLATLFNLASDAIVLTDSKGMIRDANEAFLILTDAAQLRDVVNKPLSDFLARGAVDMKLVLENTKKKGRVRSYATQVLSSVGTRANVDLASTRLSRRGGDLGFGMIIREVVPSDLIDGDASATLMSEEAMKSVMDLVGTASLKSLVSATSDVIEKMCIETAIQMTNNNRVAAAEMLGLSRQSLYVKLRKHGLLGNDADDE
ncbi:transcriptional regulator PpsR [Roseovarius faecimaris]|uniref:Transcriptional regulator PpsR n=1 Tax=Roseovarius faecimaris TaxID=2494550 RepID=A0A6I6ISU4_9RHOB|nr:transcriptional regulator PpsR [Roseovarius faecimaris]